MPPIYQRYSRAVTLTAALIAAPVLRTKSGLPNSKLYFSYGYYITEGQMFAVRAQMDTARPEPEALPVAGERKRGVRESVLGSAEKEGWRNEGLIRSASMGRILQSRMEEHLSNAYDAAKDHFKERYPIYLIVAVFVLVTPTVLWGFKGLQGGVSVLGFGALGAYPSFAEAMRRRAGIPPKPPLPLFKRYLLGWCSLYALLLIWFAFSMWAFNEVWLANALLATVCGLTIYLIFRYRRDKKIEERERALC